MFGYTNQNIVNGFVRDFRGMFNVSGGYVGAALLPEPCNTISSELA